MDPIGNRKRKDPAPINDVEETAACFNVKDSDGQGLSYVYCEDEPGLAIRSQASHPR